jgi:glycosyltransferase involved in cell wall biosynthesis
MDSHQKVRVCHIASGDLWAGAEVQVYNLVTALRADSSIEVSAILLNPGRLADELRIHGVEVKVIDESSHRFPSILREADRCLTERPVDILHSHRFKENILSALLRRRGRVRYFVQTVHGLAEPEHGLRRVKSALTTAAANLFTRRYADRVIAVSDDIGRVLSADLGEDRVTVVRNSVDIPTCDFSSCREEIRREFHLDPDQLLIGTAGRLKPVKAYDLFLKAAKVIADRFANARFLIAGDGPLRQELARQAGYLGLTDKVIFTGFRDDIQTILASLDLFVMSSHHEGIPVVLLEAMALSKPVVVTAVGGMVEVVEDNVSGLLVKAGDPQELAHTCIRLLENPEVRKTLGAGAARRVSAEFTRAQQCQRVVELYRTLMTNSETRRAATTARP